MTGSAGGLPSAWSGRTKATRFLSIVSNTIWQCWRSEVQLENDVNSLCPNYSLLQIPLAKTFATWSTTWSED